MNKKGLVAGYSNNQPLLILENNFLKHDIVQFLTFHSRL